MSDYDMPEFNPEPLDEDCEWAQGGTSLPAEDDQPKEEEEDDDE